MWTVKCEYTKHTFCPLSNISTKQNPKNHNKKTKIKQNEIKRKEKNNIFIQFTYDEFVP